MTHIAKTDMPTKICPEEQLAETNESKLVETITGPPKVADAPKVKPFKVTLTWTLAGTAE